MLIRAWCLGCMGVLFLPSCEFTSGDSATDDTATRRRLYDLEYQRNRAVWGGMPNYGGMTPVWGLGVGTNSDGVQPFYNPSALYGLPQSR